ncbi:efflux RND transporter permease subunit [Aquisphaera insulae]|uniref:efflux RND transporter permease subunit n=1 Tax=Aquisphaera insulae TaxID=2712864 RepID=UPI0013EA4B54|nr:efflux RND transporter permease subunit [Aquisphaera insulae]
MIERLIALSIRHRLAVIAAGFALALWGAYAAYTTPVDAIPDLSENQVVVFTEWPGHSPREVEDQVGYPLSLHLQGIRGVRTVRSSSDFHFSMIHVIFEDDVDFPAARGRVLERLSQAGHILPEGVVPHPPPDAVATGQIYWYTIEGGGLDLGRLRAVQDWFVRPQLAAVPGVAEVASVGGYPIEYQVNVDPRRLRTRGVTLSEVVRAVGESNATVGGPIVQKGNAEYIVRSLGWLGSRAGADDDAFDPARAARDLEAAVLAANPDGSILRVGDVATVAIGPGPRRGILEKDGNEVTGGVVLMAHGENPLVVTRRIKAKIRDLQPGLPEGVRIVPFYDRTPLIRGAIGTVTGTIAEAIATATICVVLILLHVRASFVIALTLPLAALGSFAIMAALRALGIANIETNIMSLAGIAISVGVLVDSSIVMVENAMHRLHDEFGDRPVRGDVRAVILPACQMVGRPIFFSVAIMVLSFLPVFALGGIEGKMFRPLAFTKSFALVTVALLAVTLVPALCTYLLRGRMRAERESWIVRSVIDVYRPILSSLLDRPAPLVWLLGVTFVAGLAPLGSRTLFLVTLGLALVATAAAARTWPGRALAWAGLIVVALVADRAITPLGREFITPVDEGMVMNMPVTVARASVTEAADDLKASDMILCRFPEVDMVVGKAGRAESPTDPAPIEMLETMVNFRPRAHWPRRKLLPADAGRQTRAVLAALVARGLVATPVDPEALMRQATDAALPLCDATLREFAYQRNREFERSLPGVITDPDDPGYAPQQARWGDHVRQLDRDLVPRAAEAYTRIVAEELVERAGATDPAIAAGLRAIRALRERPITPATGAPAPVHGSGVPLNIEPIPALAAVQTELSRPFAAGLLLWRKERSDLIGFGAELDQAVPMPGWANVWTMPIQNRVDMLATGVNTAIGVRVQGRRLEDIVRASEEVAAVLRRLPGAADVIADPVRGKGYLEIRIDRDRAARAGVAVAALNQAVETALGGKVAAMTVEGRERHPVRVRYGRDWRGDEDAVRALLVPSLRKEADGRTALVPLVELAEVRVVEGPATIKSENGLLRNYVRLNVRDGNAADFVASAREIVEREVKLPEGTVLGWTGQFEHEARARATLRVIVPIVLAMIFLILYLTYHDLADAALMMLAIPGAIAGGVFFQWLFGFKFSVTVRVGYIACFGMATSTGIIMLVYLREAVARAGGLAALDTEGLRRAVLEGAVNRLRPKLLTEATIILGLAPMLWADGVGAEVIRPMAAPVLGGVLIADEVIDLLLPVAFYRVRLGRLRRLGRAEASADTNG